MLLTVDGLILLACLGWLRLGCGENRPQGDMGCTNFPAFLRQSHALWLETPESCAHPSHFASMLLTRQPAGVAEETSPNYYYFPYVTEIQTGFGNISRCVGRRNKKLMSNLLRS